MNQSAKYQADSNITGSLTFPAESWHDSDTSSDPSRNPERPETRTIVSEKEDSGGAGGGGEEKGRNAYPVPSVSARTREPGDEDGRETNHQQDERRKGRDENGDTQQEEEECGTKSG
ncbi:hypothetical protein WN48_06924 [Eufriesea mexicana]|uniref:Uncharacterized protein n=1 Tax=Eufriesea mexicana TaxID=516756 RepID=A0A310SFZ4_9HYME|nr:hypothetical protein WN48_08505 [Eufriesea mexicana]OAD62270.1 hypothetical protein WN48_06924 [Eufriesea mexicana]